MADRRILETPEVLDQYKQASAELLTVLGRVVYPALHEDPTNKTGRHAVRYQRGGWHTFEIETQAGACTSFCTRFIEELDLVLVFALVRFHEPRP